MTNYIETIKNTIRDAIDFSEFMFMPSEHVVERRLGNPIRTLNWYIQRLSQTINDFDTASFENGISEQIITINNEGSGGRVPRKLSEKNNEIPSVKDFGAMGDGVTDDTNAFSSAKETGDYIFVPAGNYKVDDTLDTSKFYGIGIINGRKLGFSHALEKATTLDINAFNAAAGFERYNLDKQGTGSGNVIQGWAVDNVNNELFCMHVTGDPEKAIINKYDSLRITQNSIAYTKTASADIGHQGFNIGWSELGQRWFVAGCNKSDNDYGDKCTVFQLSVTDDNVNINNMRKVKLFRTNINQNVTTAVSVSSKYLLAENNSDDSCTIRIFDFQKIVSTDTTDISNDYLNEFTFDIDTKVYPVQSLACDDTTIYVFAGYGLSKGADLKCYTFDMLGSPTGTFVVNIGEQQALTEGAHCEVEGAGWTYVHNRPVLSIGIASGSAGNRTNRIYQLGGGTGMVIATKTNQPAYMSVGAYDYGVLSGQALHLGHYDPTEDYFDKGMTLHSDSRVSFSQKNTGDVTVAATDKTSTVNNVGEGRFTRIGNLITFSAKCRNLSISSLSAGNLYFRISADSDKNWDVPVFDAALSVVVSDFTQASDSYYLNGYIDEDGYISIREMRNGASNVIADVAQLNGADVYISGSYICVD